MVRERVKRILYMYILEWKTSAYFFTRIICLIKINTIFAEHTYYCAIM